MRRRHVIVGLVALVVLVSAALAAGASGSQRAGTIKIGVTIEKTGPVPILGTAAIGIQAAAKWINAHVQERQSIWVMPEYMTYPLMYHAPKAVYAWQLRYPPEPRFAGLDPIHFRGVVPPDYVIAFGPIVRDIARILRSRENMGIKYEQAETLEIFWHDRFRPDLTSRTFKPITDFDRNLEAIYIFQRVSPPLTPPKLDR